MIQKVVKISKIKPNPNNPRLIKDDKFRKLVQSIKDFPEMMELREVVVDENMIILGGNMRYKAAIEAGMKEVPIKIAEGLTEEQKQEFIIKDNVGFGEWDWEILGNLFEEDQLGEWGLDIHEFAGVKHIATDDNFEVPADGFETDIKQGDIIEIGQHRLLCGDSTKEEDVSVLMGGKLADIVITDPPYGVSYIGKTKEELPVHNDGIDGLPLLLGGAFSNYTKNIKDGSPIYVFHPPGGIQHTFWTECLLQGWKISQQLIWAKSSMVLGHSDYHYKHEPITLCYKNEKGNRRRGSDGWYGDNSQVTVIEADRPNRNADHPTMKPISLYDTFLKNHAKDNDIMIDLFAGSGTCFIASHQRNVLCYGIELSPRYCQVIVNRMLNLDSELVIKINGKPYIQKDKS